MEEILYLKELLKEKERKVETEEDKARVENLKVILNNDNLFFEIDSNTACGILYFLGIPENEIMTYYTKLISPIAYQKTNEHYITISSKK